MHPETQQVQDGEVAPEMETAEGHTGSDHVSHGANSNLTPTATQTGNDEAAARVIEQQHQREAGEDGSDQREDS